jgi:hypothetical protein
MSQLVIASQLDEDFNEEVEGVEAARAKLPTVSWPIWSATSMARRWRIGRTCSAGIDPESSLPPSSRHRYLHTF